jgi:hypothetical protein
MIRVSERSERDSTASDVAVEGEKYIVYGSGVKPRHWL